MRAIDNELQTESRVDCILNVIQNFASHICLWRISLLRFWSLSKISYISSQCLKKSITGCSQLLVI
uniref:Uncharacterized protein n=1 Tax=Arion vulgaris TaxID=1028688 RepID=A0A0B6ZQ89_9EUPU